jgi:DNA-binding transcriptional regulator YiaG
VICDEFFCPRSARRLLYTNSGIGCIDRPAATGDSKTATLMVSRSKQLSSPSTWSKNIADLRGGLGLTQTAFGKRLNASAMSVSRWERGEQEPTSEAYITLGKLAGEPLRWYFWERVGLSKEDWAAVPEIHAQLKVANLEAVRAGAGKKKAKLPDLVAIPLLKVAVASHGENGDPESSFRNAPIESVIAAPRDWCPSPSTTRCLRVSGDSMKPLIHDGYILAADTSQIDHEKLDGKIVIAWHRDKGLTVSRLHAYDHTEVLCAENAEYKAVVLDKRHPWRIVAKVLWWIAKAP